METQRCMGVKGPPEFKPCDHTDDLVDTLFVLGEREYVARLCPRCRECMETGKPRKAG